MGINNRHETKNSNMLDNNQHEIIGMKHSISMPELSEIREIIEFDNVMEEIHEENIISSTTNTNSDKRYTAVNSNDKTTERSSFDLYNCAPLLSNDISNNENIYQSESNNQKYKEAPGEKNLIPFLTDDEVSDDDKIDCYLPEFKGGNSFDTKDTTAMTSLLRKSSSFSELDQLKKRVHFGDIEVREYGVTLGDHPDCVRGPPISLDWDYVELESKDLETYESSRGPRRRRETLVMSLIARKQLLLNTGFTKYELREAANEVKKVQKNRTSSDKYYPVYDAGFAIRSVAKSLRKSIVSSSPSKKGGDIKFTRSVAS